MKFLSPAKVNLNLEVRQRRPDGYHEIQTLMHRIDLADEIEIDREGEGVSLSVSTGRRRPRGRRTWLTGPPDSFFRETKIAGGVRIRLRKRIPVAAGLGGGSSNAATVLMGLNELFGAQIEERLLMAWGAGPRGRCSFFYFQEAGLGRRQRRKARGREGSGPIFGFCCWFLLSGSPPPGPMPPMTGWG